MGRTRGHMESEINKVPGAHNPSSVWSGCLLGGWDQGGHRLGQHASRPHGQWAAPRQVEREPGLMLGKTEGKRRGQQRMRWLDGITDSINEFEQAPGDGEGQGSLVCCYPWGRKESDMTATEQHYLKMPSQRTGVDHPQGSSRKPPSPG